jgi:hypothetical protein
VREPAPQSALISDPRELDDELDELLDDALAGVVPQRARHATQRGVAPAPAAREAPVDRAQQAQLVAHGEAPQPWQSVSARSRVVGQAIHHVPEDPRPRGATWTLLATLAALVFAGFVLWRGLRSESPPPPARPPVASAEPGLASRVAPAVQTEQAEQAEPAETETGPRAELGFGRVLPFIDRSRDIEVKQGEGLLVVEYEAGGTPPEVQVAGRDPGPAPTQVALAPGRHELVLKRGERSSFRYLVIRAGETRIVDVE